MLAKEIKKDIFWVGAIDWDLREFHGYRTPKGSSYNSYLVIDKKTVLIDTVKEYKFDEMLSRIKSIIDPSKIDYIVINHVEMDHSGSLPKILEIAKNAKIISNKFGIEELKKHFFSLSENSDIFIEIKTGDKINIGSKNLEFIQIPMVHWPDSMITFVPEYKILFPNDAFGQHIAHDGLFDYCIEKDILFHEAKSYYANIVLCYGNQVQKAFEYLAKLDFDTICASHGMIWTKKEFLDEILSKYKNWAENLTEKKAVIIFDSMWHSTEKIAYKIYEAFEQQNIFSVILDLKYNHVSDVMTELIDAEYICVGSPTLNNNMMPTVSGFLTYMKGL
ncbi:MAG: FprA family A-type flavoprotein, partial [Elusimicrobiota bacterium]|nr:FprA family A-type flavoprotein [Elusimicrobiota bacterium]